MGLQRSDVQIEFENVENLHFERGKKVSLGPLDGNVDLFEKCVQFGQLQVITLELLRCDKNTNDLADGAAIMGEHLVI